MSICSIEIYLYGLKKDENNEFNNMLLKNSSKGAFKC